MLGLTIRTCHFVQNISKKRTLYLTLVRSIFERCSVVWRPYNQTRISKFESIQKRAIKWILSEEFSSYGARNTYLRKCKEVNILPLNSRFDINDLAFFHKIIYGLIPVELPSYLGFSQGSRLRSSHLNNHSLISSITPKISSRNNNDIISNSNVSCISSFRAFENSYFYRTHLKWNKLPLEVKEISSHTIFKNKLETLFWKDIQASYSVQDSNSWLGDDSDIFDDGG